MLVSEGLKCSTEENHSAACVLTCMPGGMNKTLLQTVDDNRVFTRKCAPFIYAKSQHVVVSAPKGQIHCTHCLSILVALPAFSAVDNECDNVCV